MLLVLGNHTGFAPAFFHKRANYLIPIPQLKVFAYFCLQLFLLDLLRSRGLITYPNSPFPAMERGLGGEVAGSLFRLRSLVRPRSL